MPFPLPVDVSPLGGAVVSAAPSAGGVEADSPGAGVSVEDSSGAGSVAGADCSSPPEAPASESPVSAGGVTGVSSGGGGGVLRPLSETGGCWPPPPAGGLGGAGGPPFDSGVVLAAAGLPTGPGTSCGSTGGELTEASCRTWPSVRPSSSDLSESRRPVWADGAPALPLDGDQPPRAIVRPFPSRPAPAASSTTDDRKGAARFPTTFVGSAKAPTADAGTRNAATSAIASECDPPSSQLTAFGAFRFRFFFSSAKCGTRNLSNSCSNVEIPLSTDCSFPLTATMSERQCSRNAWSYARSCAVGVRGLPDGVCVKRGSCGSGSGSASCT